MTKTIAVLLAASLSVFVLAQAETFEFRGEVPPQVPDGTVVEAVYTENLIDFGLAPLARGEVMDGSFSILLPAKLDAGMLQESHVSCSSSLDIVLIPYLEVVEGDEVLGQFWRTRDEPGDWGMRGPSNFTYLAYVAEEFVVDEDCFGDLVQLDLQPGWNLYTRIVTDTGSLTTSAEPPEDFVWRFLR